MERPVTALIVVLCAIVGFHLLMNAWLDPDTHPIRRRYISPLLDDEGFGWPWQVRWWRCWLADWEGRFWRALILSGYYVVPENTDYRDGRFRSWRMRWAWRPCPLALPCFWCACTRSWKRALTFWWRGYP